MQIPSSRGRREDAVWGVATVLAAILVLPFIPIVLVVSAGERWKNIIAEGGFTLQELRKYFVPGNLVLANMVCGGDHGVKYDVVVPMVIILGDGMVMQPNGITYNSIADAHFDCIFAVANNEQAGDSGGTGLADGVTLLYSVTEVLSYANRTSTSSLKGFTVFDVVSHAI